MLDFGGSLKLLWLSPEKNNFNRPSPLLTVIEQHYSRNSSKIISLVAKWQLQELVSPNFDTSSELMSLRVCLRWPNRLKKVLKRYYFP